MNVGLFFGSFNPIHTGHLIIGSYMEQNTIIDEVWFVVSPQNPFKQHEELLHQNIRLNLVKAAIKDNTAFKSCDVEFNLPKPSYTINTLAHLKNVHPKYQFILIIGGDNLAAFNKWKNYEEILAQNKIFVYSRNGFIDEAEITANPNVTVFNVPLLNISSTYIRENIKAGKLVKYLVHDEVLKLINNNSYYM